MSKAQELKPCVFCNSVNLTVFDQPCIAWIQCGDCEADGPPKDTAAEAIEAWNRAPASSEQQAAQQDAALVKPEAGRYVLAWMEGREVPIRAMWVPAKWLLANDECPEDWAEYDEAKDRYFCTEGWYEKNEHEDTHWGVTTPVVAWMDLPQLAVRASNGGKA